MKHAVTHCVSAAARRSSPQRSATVSLAVLVALLAVLGLNLAVFAGRTAEPAAPQAGAPTVVSYQGQVTVGGIAPTGTGYFKFAIVNLAGDTTYWSNDGKSVDGGQPEAAVPLDVSNGLFNVMLGSTALTGMTQPLTADTFSGAIRYLRVWFSGNETTFILLSPDRRIAAVPYALQATNADFLDGEQGSYYQDATNLNAGTLAIDRYSAYADLNSEGFLNDASGGLARNNSTLQSTLNADLLDGAHASAFQQKYDNVVVVAKSGGDYTTIGAALAAISATATDRYLIWVAPGNYTESVTMEPYVDIQGAGEGVTKITASGSASTAAGTVLGANNAELRFLTVENTGGAAFATAIKNASAAPRIAHVTCAASGGTSSSYGVYNDTGSPAMTHVAISVSGGTAFGVYNSGSSAPVLTDVTISASSTSSNYGIRSEGASTPTLRNVTVTAAGGSGSNWGIRNDSPVTLLNVVATASGPSGSSNYGVYNTDVVTMTQVTARASGGYDTYGVFNSSAQVVMLDVDATASDASHTNSGVYSTYTSAVTMTQVVANVSGAATSNYGIYNAASSSATMRLLTVEATNGTAVNEYVYGVYNNTSEFTLDNSQISANGGSVCYGVFNVAASGAYTVKINNSQITGRTHTIFNISNDSEFTTFVGASQLAGGAVSAGGGTVTCAGVYDEAYTFSASTCP